jgi:signal transduction histidine kinase
VLAGLGIIAVALGFLLRDERFADVAFWLMLPLWILGFLMLIAIWPLLIVSKRRERRSKTRRDGPK